MRVVREEEEGPPQILKFKRSDSDQSFMTKFRETSHCCQQLIDTQCAPSACSLRVAVVVREHIRNDDQLFQFRLLDHVSLVSKLSDLKLNHARLDGSKSARRLW